MKLKPLLALATVLAVLAVAAGAYAGARYASGGEGGPPESDRPLIGPTPIPASEQLPVTAQDIQQGTDGKYFVPDRGDGCEYRQAGQVTFESQEWLMFSTSLCELGWAYAPATGEVRPVPLVTPDKLPTTTPSDYRGPTPTPAPLAVAPKPGRSDGVWPEDIKLGGDGKYSTVDTGDGCEYHELLKFTEGSVEWVHLQSPTCEPDILIAPATGEVRAVEFPYRLGPDGKYLKVDHVGCNYREVSRFTEEGRLWIRLESPTHCQEAILYAPTRGEERKVRPPSPTPTPTATPPIKGVPRGDLPSASEIKLGPDGKYFIADRGDGCPWTESGRITFLDGTVDISFRTECDANFFWSFRPQTGEVFGGTR